MALDIFMFQRTILGVIACLSLFLTEGIPPKDKNIKVLPGSTPPLLATFALTLLPYIQWFATIIYYGATANPLSKWERIGFASLIFGCCLQFYCRYLLKNHYTFSISIKPNHTIYKESIYSIIRHPGYLSAVFMFGGTLLFCQNAASLFSALLPIVLIVKICPSEEAFLKKNVDGYDEYINAVKYKLIPFIY